MPKLFMDSGAYSAETKGSSIPLNEYISFLKGGAADYCDVYAALDVLFDPEGTAANVAAMEVAGCLPLPTYHYGEDPRWLVGMVRCYDYIALGGQVGQSTENLIAWLDDIWSTYLTDLDGRPLVKVHAFGVTSIPVMTRYPWFSVDSTSWVLSCAYGRAAFYRADPFTGAPDIELLAVTDKNPARDTRNQHVDSMTSAQRSGVDQLAASRGWTIEQLAKDDHARYVCNAQAYVDVANAIPYRPFKRRSSSLFGDLPSEKLRRPVEPWSKLSLYLAGWPGVPNLTYALLERGYNRLLSYHYIRSTKTPHHWLDAKRFFDAHYKQD